MLKILKKNNAFSLVEVIVAVAIFVLLATGVFSVVSNSYRNYSGSGDKQTVVEFAQEGIEIVKSIRDNGWQQIENAADGTDQGVAKNASGYWEFSGTSNTQGDLTRVIVLSAVTRDSNGDIVASGGTDDPNTKKVTVTVSATGMSNYVLTTYITNWAYKTWSQNDWSGIGDREFWSNASMASSSVSDISTSTANSLVLGVPTSFANGYSYRKAIVIDNTQVSGSGDFSSFPIFFSDSLSYLKTVTNGGAVTSDNGYDIIFTSDSSGSVQLDHEIERYSSSTGQFEAWVRVPTLAYSADTTIYMFYSSASVSTSQENPSSVWDSDYVEVTHMAEDPSVSTDGDCAGVYKPICDSTSNNNDFYAGGTMTSSDRVEGKVGYSYDLDGIDDFLLVPNSTSLSAATGAGQARTLSLWLNMTSAVDGGLIADKASSRLHYWLRAQGIDGDITGGVASSGTYLDSNPAPGEGSWKYITLTYDGSNQSLYVDGSLNNGPVTATAPADDTNVLLLGGGVTGTYMDAYFDELRISKIARSADWISTEYNNMSSTSTFYSLQDVVGYSSSGTLYSSIFDLGSTDKEIKSISVEQNVPASCNLQITAQVSDDATFAAANIISETYSDTSASFYTSSTDATLNGKRYLRYKVYMEACNSNADTPTLYNVRFNYR